VDWAGGWFGKGDGASVGQINRGAGGGASIEVEADELGHVVGAGAAGYLGGAAFLDYAAVFDDDQAVCEDHGVEWVVGDEQGAAFITAEVLTEFGADVERRTGVQGS
jgi:hypothetical protein